MERAGVEQPGGENHAFRRRFLQSFVHDPKPAAPVEDILKPDARRFMPACAAENREHRLGHALRECQVRRAELLRPSREEAVVGLFSALVRFKQCDVADHLGCLTALRNDDPVIGPAAKLLRCAHEIGLVASTDGIAQYVAYGGANGPVERECLVTGHGFVLRRNSRRSARSDAPAWALSSKDPRPRETPVTQPSAARCAGCLGPVEDHRELIRAAARLMTAAKLVWVLSLRMAMRLNSFSLQK